MVVHWTLNFYTKRMFAHELLRALESLNFKNNFCGIYSSDNIPKTLKNRHFIILNTDVKSGPGKHWYTVVRIGDCVECFDSLGIDEPKKYFLRSNFNFDGIRFISCNITPLQPITSTLCGQYVLFFLFERYHNFDIDFNELINTVFTSDTFQNDEIVKSFIKDFIENGCKD